MVFKRGEEAMKTISSVLIRFICSSDSLVNPAFHNLNAICAACCSFFLALASGESFGRTTLGGSGNSGRVESVRVSCGMAVVFSESEGGVFQPPDLLGLVITLLKKVSQHNQIGVDGI
jgi:hypothetical protein